VTATNQPVWDLYANYGDVNPLDHGGYFVFVDTTGVYQPEAVHYQAETRTVHRFILEPCTYVNSVLSDNPSHPEISAWFADNLQAPADFGGYSVADLIADFVGDELSERAMAWHLIGEYYGFDNLDHSPYAFETKKEAATQIAKWMGDTMTAKPESLLDAADAFLVRVLYHETNEVSGEAFTVCGVCQEVDGHTDSCFIPAMTAWATED